MQILISILDPRLYSSFFPKFSISLSLGVCVSGIRDSDELNKVSVAIIGRLFLDSSTRRLVYFKPASKPRSKRRRISIFKSRDGKTVVVYRNYSEGGGE